jgi:hypothetical protein
MVFTDVNATTLVSWFTTCIIFIFSASLFMSKNFKRYYCTMMESMWSDSNCKAINWAPTPRVFGLVWILIAGFKVTSTTIWTMNYSLCTNTYFIVFVSLTLAELVGLASWAPLFIKWGKPYAAFRMVFFAMLCAIVNTVLMAISLSLNPATLNPQDACIADKTSGIIAVVLYAVPILWYMIACYLLWQWKNLPKEWQYCHWKKIKPTITTTKKEKEEPKESKATVYYKKYPVIITYEKEKENPKNSDAGYYNMESELYPAATTQKKKFSHVK